MTPAQAAESVIKRMLPLAKIVKDQALQVRGAVNPATVKEYEAIIQEHKFMDPLDLFYQDPIGPETQFRVADGFHRIEAYTNCGVEKVPCNLRVGGTSEALRFTLFRNGHHGNPMTNAQKRSAADKAVLDPAIGALKDVEIARLVGCSATLIGQARRGENKSQTAAKSKERQQKAGGKGSGPPLVPVTAHERRAPNASPTKAMILRQIEEYVTRDQVDEAEVVALFETKDAQYCWTGKPGAAVRLKVVGKSGRAQIEVDCIVKSVGVEEIVLKSEEQRLSVAESPKA